MIPAVTKILRCYVDTSVFNWALAVDRGEEHEKTLVFLEACRKGAFEAFISTLVLEELGDTPDERKRKSLMGQVHGTAPVLLEMEEPALILADRYIQEKVIPARARDDARHAAIAAVHNLDVVVSWNMEHLVRVATRRGVNAVNQLAGYKPIEIATPAEVL
jgi:predicted nucleic acid-binding protein